MSSERIQSVARRLIATVGAAGGLISLVAAAGCDRTKPVTPASWTTLRIGVGGLPLVAPQAGLRQVVGALSLEALVAPNDDGQLRPSLAESWTTATDGLSIDVRLRDGKFHDGSPVTSELVAQSLRKDLPGLMGPAFDDVERIEPVDARQLRIVLRQPSPLVLEALDIAIQKPGKTGIGTGPYVASAASLGELHANPDYYGGSASIGRVVITAYPSVRTAWAELLRGNIDMLHEVNINALDSLEGSRAVAVFSYLRHYQYMIFFSSRASSLASAEVRRELNAAIDRDALVRETLSGHGLVSTGPIPPQHWALDQTAPKFTFDRSLASKLMSQHLQFTCLVPADSVYERVALGIKQQLAAASVDMRVEEATQEQILKATRDNNYEAVLLDPISGPTVFRSYRAFYSKVPFTPKPRSSVLIDAALDRLRHAKSDAAYRAGVAAFQQAVVDDPPALFVAWGERARAVSRQFEVVVPENGRDVLATLRLWRPAGAPQLASRN